MIKILIPTKSNFYASWLQERTEVELVDEVKSADLILFTGGEDVDPSVYGDKKHRTTYSNIQRDKMEIAIYENALAEKIPMLGICRGAQLLTALQPGGFLIQDVTNHGRTHDITFTNNFDDADYSISSTHHQMMYPFNVDDHKIIAYASDNLSRAYETGAGPIGRSSMDCEPEVVFYPNTKCFAIQGHPEMMSFHNPTVEKLFGLMIEKLKLTDKI